MNVVLICRRCFISHAYAGFIVAVIPVLLLMLAVCAVFIQAYQVTPQWKYYDDIYRGRYNIKGKETSFLLDRGFLNEL